jgi:hypothetical protein
MQQLGFAQRQVHSTGPEACALEALSAMSQKGVSALAVVDGCGKIIGNFSVSDMRWGAVEVGGREGLGRGGWRQGCVWACGPVGSRPEG